MLLEKQSSKSNIETIVGDSTFKLLQDIHDGNEPHNKLVNSSINSNSATLYLARELDFLHGVAAASGHKMTSQLLYELHVELLKKSLTNVRVPITR